MEQTPGKHFRQTSNGHLHIKLGSDRYETLPKRVSDDSRRFIFRHRKIFVAEILDRKIRFLQIWRVFRGSTAKRTSKSSSASNFALDRLILRSVRPNIVKNGRWPDTDGWLTDGRTQR